MTGDQIIRMGTEPAGMYFVSQGAVEVVAGMGDILAVLGPSSFFGEMALLHPEGRSVATIRVRTYCEGYRLSRMAFERIVSLHPTFKDYLESVAKMRLRKQVKKGNNKASLLLRDRRHHHRAHTRV